MCLSWRKPAGAAPAISLPPACFPILSSLGRYLVLTTCTSFSMVSLTIWKCDGRLLDLEWTFLAVDLPIPRL